MQSFIGTKVLSGLLLVASSHLPAFAFDEVGLRNADRNPPPLQVDDYGPDPAGFHFKWATDAEIRSNDGKACYHLNRATHGILNNSSEPLVFKWDDALHFTTKTHPLDRSYDWDIQTTARDFRLVAPSEIKLGQSLTHSAQGAAYVPIRATEPECEGEQQPSPPPLKSTMSHDILRDNEPATLLVSIESLPVIEDGLVTKVENIVTVNNLEGAAVGLSSIPEFLGRLSASARDSNIQSIKEELSEYGAEYIQLPLINRVNEADLVYVPENIQNLEYGFVVLGEASSVTLSLTLESSNTFLEERWFSVVAVDADGSVISNGLASAWIPQAQ